MSTTLEGIDARAYQQNWLKALTGMYISDINAIPDEKWNETLGGCTRSAGELTADAISLLQWTASSLQGNSPSGEGDYMERLKNECNTRSGAVAAFQNAVQAFDSALGSASDETLTKMITAPFGMEMPMFMIVQIAVSHVWYHDGQLNYIQCLLGDDKIHWMGA